MPEKELFRKTPFNGYNRDDVLNYMKEQDLRLTELNAENENLKKDGDKRLEEISALKKEIREKEKFIEETEKRVAEEGGKTLREAAEKRQEEIDEISKETERLREENEQLKKEIEHRDGMITVFDNIKENELTELREKIKAADEASERNEKIIEELKTELAAANFVNSKSELEETKTALIVLRGKYDELKAAADEKEKIAEVLKSELLLKDEVIKSFREEMAFATEKLNEAEAEKEKAVTDMSNGNAEAEELLRSAKIKSEYMVKNAEYFAYSTKERLISVKKSIDNALDNIEKSMASAENLSDGKEE